MKKTANKTRKPPRTTGRTEKANKPANAESTTVPKSDQATRARQRVEEARQAAFNKAVSNESG